LEPVLYTRGDFASQTQPIEIQRVVSKTGAFDIEPNHGALPAMGVTEFSLVFAPLNVSQA
jgi:hypothetical protein